MFVSQNVDMQKLEHVFLSFLSLLDLFFWTVLWPLQDSERGKQACQCAPQST